MPLAHVGNWESEAGVCYTHDWNDFPFHNISASDALSLMPTFRGRMAADDERLVAFGSSYSRWRKVSPATVKRTRGWPLRRRVHGDARSMRQVGELGGNNCP